MQYVGTGFRELEPGCRSRSRLGSPPSGCPCSLAQAVPKGSLPSSAAQALPSAEGLGSYRGFRSLCWCVCCVPKTPGLWQGPPRLPCTPGCRKPQVKSGLVLLGGHWALEGTVALASLVCLEAREEGAAEMQVATDLASIAAAEPRVRGLAGTGCFGASEEHHDGQGMGFEGCAHSGSWSLAKVGSMGLAAGGAESRGGNAPIWSLAADTAQAPRCTRSHSQDLQVFQQCCSASLQEPGRAGGIARAEARGGLLCINTDSAHRRASSSFRAQPGWGGDQRQERVLWDGSGAQRGSSQHRSRDGWFRF